jgi:hypothetical protein
VHLVVMGYGGKSLLSFLINEKKLIFAKKEYYGNVA